MEYISFELVYSCLLTTDILINVDKTLPILVTVLWLYTFLAGIKILFG